MSLGTWASGGMGSEQAHLSRDEVFDLLANARRRGVLRYLRRVEGAADLRDMAARIAAWEYGTAVEELTADQRKRVYTSLQQTHLPTLADAGIVEYDDDAAEVHSTDVADEIDVYLEIVPGRAFPWREYYLALGAVSSALVFVVWVDVGAFGRIPDIALAALLATTLTLSATVHVYRERTMRLGSGDGPPTTARE